MPEFTSPTSFTVLENSLVAATVTASDPEGDAVTFSFASSTEVLGVSIAAYYDANKFYIDPRTGVITFATAPNFEAPSDYGANGTYDLMVKVSDAYGSSLQLITITIANVNEGLVISSNGGGASATVTAAENQTFVTTVVARDFTGPSVTYAISGGYDASKFVIDSTTGVLSFRSPFDYETAGSRTFNVVVTASDGQVTDSQTLSVGIGNVNEAPSIWNNNGAEAAAVAVDENISVSLLNVYATDPDNDTRTYSIVGGADAARFRIDPSTGALAFISRPDFEAAGDADGDNVYEVVVAAGDGQFTDTQRLSVTVRNVDEAPVITSPSSFVIAENGSAVTTVTAHDPDGQAVSYTLAGSDAARFTIDAATGVLSFIAPPNYEAPTDSGGNNVYNVDVLASDGTVTTRQALIVRVANVNEGVAFVSNGGGDEAAVSIQEKSGNVTVLEAVDPEGAMLQYGIDGGDDAALFEFDSFTGTLRFKDLPDFEAPADADGDGVYQVRVGVTDGELFDFQTISVTVTDLPETIAFDTPSRAFSVAENGAAIGYVQVGPAGAAEVRYGIDGGADAALFVIDRYTGALSFVDAPDFERPADAGGDNVYDVIVFATDGVSEDLQAVSVTVEDAEDPVSFAADKVIEYRPEGDELIVTTVTAVTPNGDAVTYSLGGEDAHLFDIDPKTGLLSFREAADFEAPRDANRDNSYRLTVVAAVGSSKAAQDLTVVIQNVNEKLTLVSNGGGDWAQVSLNENNRTVTTVLAKDVDGDAVTYSIAGGADAVRFTIDSKTGVLEFFSAPDFETPRDANGDNVYEVVVVASDGEFKDQQALSVRVLDLLESRVVYGTSSSETISPTSYRRTSETADTVYAGGGSDKVYGAGGNDTLHGESGNDMLNGGAGADRLIGGIGADSFTFSTIGDSRPGEADTIADFNYSQGDKINLGEIDADLGLAGDQAFKFIGNQAFSNVAGQLRFETVGGNTVVYGDVDGDGAADLQIVLQGQIPLIQSDFFL